MSEEAKILRKLVEILEPYLIEECKKEICYFGYLAEGTRQSLAKLEKAKEILGEIDETCTSC